jgi:c-di-GMP-binding flagellar brake protein YcgR
MTSNAKADAVASSHREVERRRQFRIDEPFPVKVRGKDPSGEKFDIDTTLDNIGATGLYVRLSQNIKPGADIFVVVRLSASNDESVFAPRVAIHGEVLRCEQQPDGSHGVAVGFHQRRFL